MQGFAGWRASRGATGMVVLAALALGCFGRGGEIEVERVEDPAILAFAERIGTFYDSIENRSLNALITFEDSELRGFFQDASEFADYYASLADQVKTANFRYARAETVLVREFRFAAPDRAEVDVVLIGKHQRALRFWEIEIRRTDAWVRAASGDWVVAPEKL